MDLAAFQLLISKRVPAHAVPGDPLAEALNFLARHGETAEGQALRHMLRTLDSAKGPFEETDAWLFGRETSPIIAGLIDARLSGRYSDAEWRPDLGRPSSAPARS